MALRRKSAVGSAVGSVVFPGFTDVAEIGAGSISTVYRARELHTNRRVALKLLNVRDASARAVESFQRESAALGELSTHPNIVTLYRTFPLADGRPVLVLELCTGAMFDRVRGGVGVPAPEAVAVGIKVAAALETAHRAQILHRDVKPQNILITEFGEPALADFGVAMLQSSTQTTAGLFDFTTLHAAPELLEGGATSAATDVYELASTLYQLIAGQSAFRAYDGESPASVILRILRDPVRPVLADGVPVQLSDLLIRAMSKDQSQRPPTAAEFAAELAAIEAAQGWPATRFLVRDVLAAEPTPVQQYAVQQYPIPPAAAPEPAPVPDVPTWAVRGVEPVPEAAVEVPALNRRLTVRAGLSVLTADEAHLTMRTGLRRFRLPWRDVLGFEPRLERRHSPGTYGSLAALTTAGPVDLPATRRRVAELRDVHALLDAFRVRANASGDRPASP